MIGETFMLRIVLLMVLSYGAITNLSAAEAVIMVLGDSLSAGYNIEIGQGWVAQLQRQLTEEGYPHRVVNASISGETTHGALARLEGLLAEHHPAIVIVELGGNDGLRGLALEEVRKNLSEIIDRSQQQGAKVLLIKMQLPTNYGPVYTEKFQKLYDELVREYRIASAPFVLEGIADRSELMQEDSIHPRAEAQYLMLNNVWPALRPLL
jgi:acyl-CoA thioesterase I